MQWGVGPNLGNNVYVNVTFPIPFPTGCVGIANSPYNNGIDSIDDGLIVVLNKTASGFRYVNGTSGGPKSLLWFAYGY